MTADLDGIFSKLSKVVSGYKVQEFVAKKLNVTFEEAKRMLMCERDGLAARLILVQTIANGCSNNEDAEKQLCLEIIQSAKKTHLAVLHLADEDKCTFISAFNCNEDLLNSTIADSKEKLLALEDLESQLQKGE